MKHKQKPDAIQQNHKIIQSIIDVLTLRSPPSAPSFVGDRVEDNINPVGRLYYAASTTPRAGAIRTPSRCIRGSTSAAKNGSSAR